MIGQWVLSRRLGFMAPWGPFQHEASSDTMVLFFWISSWCLPGIRLVDKTGMWDDLDKFKLLFKTLEQYWAVINRMFYTEIISFQMQDGEEVARSNFTRKDAEVTRANLNLSQTGTGNETHCSGTQSTILAYKAYKTPLLLCSASAAIRYSLLGTEWQRGFELTGETLEKINENDKKLENMTYKERLNIRLV